MEKEVNFNCTIELNMQEHEFSKNNTLLRIPVNLGKKLFPMRFNLIRKKFNKRRLDESNF